MGKADTEEMNTNVWRKETKTKRISKKLLWGYKIKIKNFDFFFFHIIKMEQEAIYFGENARSFPVRHLVDACTVSMFIFLSFNKDAALIR